MASKSSSSTGNERYRKAWAAMERDDRRRVLRAVNRMQPLEDPAEAALAVEFAQRQRRLWTRWWWVIPIMGALIALPAGYEAALVNVVTGLVLVGGLGALFSWRAGRAARVNQEVVDAARAKGKPGGVKKSNRSRKRTRRKSKR